MPSTRPATLPPTTPLDAATLQVGRAGRQMPQVGKPAHGTGSPTRWLLTAVETRPPQWLPHTLVVDALIAPQQNQRVEAQPSFDESPYKSVGAQVISDTKKSAPQHDTKRVRPPY
jgi:hypothetical protein